MTNLFSEKALMEKATKWCNELDPYKYQDSNGDEVTLAAYLAGAKDTLKELRELLEKKINQLEEDSRIHQYLHHDFAIALYKELLAELKEEKVTPK